MEYLKFLFVIMVFSLLVVSFVGSATKQICLLILLQNITRYNGKLERFFRTTRDEAEKGSIPESALICHNHWISHYNCFRTHSSLLDSSTLEIRFYRKKTFSTPLSKSLDLHSTFSVSTSVSSAISRTIKSNKSISYKKQSLFPFSL